MAPTITTAAAGKCCSKVTFERLQLSCCSRTTGCWMIFDRNNFKLQLQLLFGGGWCSYWWWWLMLWSILSPPLLTTTTIPIYPLYSITTLWQHSLTSSVLRTYLLRILRFNTFSFIWLTLKQTRHWQKDFGNVANFLVSYYI